MKGNHVELFSNIRVTGSNLSLHQTFINCCMIGSVTVSIESVYKSIESVYKSHVTQPPPPLQQ